MAIESKAYNPENVENRWYSAWKDAGCFKGDATSEKPPYAIMIPPPNVTGVLTMGHVLNNSIQDVLIRNARQHGFNTMWLPGTDHAGIATQTRVERELRKTGKTRHDLGREAFLEVAVDWRDKHGGIILKQLQSLGCSCDWDRTVHTLDPDYSQAVITAFVELYKRGYVYRGKRMVNWCPVSLTALSDEEVIMKPQKGTLFKMRYRIEGEPEAYIEISTTRPETLMGDTAVAVHPDDPRYQKWIGKHAIRPFPEARIPIVADRHVDKDFGTGALKVTPAHDKADFEIGLRHNLEVRDVFNPDGTLNHLAGEPFVGMDRFEARKLAAEKLDSMGLLLAREDYENNVGYSERADVPIEPRLSEQWFLRYPKVEEARRAVSEGHIRFFPERWEKTYLHWLENIQDWCISRQLWWGHRIPVWYRKESDRSEPSNWHVSVNGPSDPENWEQDEDVLDTWASSWLWPFATLGWPDADAASKQGLNTFYPTSVLVTGPDIIFFWVARMIMAGLEFMGTEKSSLSSKEIAPRVPFKNVYFTGIIRDIQGRKMSKSLGNSPDPLDLIAKFGADGLRFSILHLAPLGQDIRFSEDSVEQGRNFCNKIWNACRFRQMSGDNHPNHSLDVLLSRLSPSGMDAVDRAMLGRLVATMTAVREAMDGFLFTQVTHQLFAFFWNDFCDWYVEVSKSKLKQEGTREACLAVQDLVIRQFLMMLHPVCPFITEELWHLMDYGSEGSFISDTKPETGSELAERLRGVGISDWENDIRQIDCLRESISLLRALKADAGVSTNRSVRFVAVPRGDEASEVLSSHHATLLSLVGMGHLETAESAPSGMPAVVTPLGSFSLDLSGAVDVEKESARLSKEIDRLDGVIRGIDAKLSNASFVANAPDAVVEGARRQREENAAKREQLAGMLGRIRSSS
jgi:valyl-tRNA synthetase